MLCSGFRFSLSVHLLYLRLLTVLPAILILQPVYQTVSDDFFLYYISFVYLKSIKDLSSFRLPFYRKADAKVNAFFHSAKLSGSFFSKKFFFQGNRKDDFLAPLNNTKVRYLHSPKPDPAQNFSACRFSYLSPLSRKRLQRYSLFPFLQIL